MSTWIDDIAGYIASSTASIGTVYIQNMPSTAGSFTIIYPYAGMPSDFTMNSDGFHRPRLNVLVTSTATDGGHQKSIDIKTRLDHAYDLRLPSSSAQRHYLLIQCLGEPEYLGKDVNGRGQFVTNYQVEYQDITT
jgi:hypothetical protein